VRSNPKLYSLGYGKWMGYVRLSQAAKHFNVCTRTLIRWEAAGKIKVDRSPGGKRIYDLNSLDPNCERTSYIYVRVSSHKQKNDLCRQEKHMLDQYPGHTVVSDVGSGLNFKRKGLLSLLEQSERGLVQEIVVASKDRLCRFGFDLLAWIFDSKPTRR
jgi:putative resolvase